MAESGLRFRRNVIVDNKEESVDLLTLALKRNAEYSKESFPEFLDLVYYVKQLLAFIVGCIWGIIPLTGVFGVFCGLVIIFGLTLFYTNRFLCVDTQDFDLYTVAGEGAMPAICLFLVMWIVAYSALHF
ncbi:hypothetical protein WA171_005721 [Blastocystis sp. BT1]